jgi:hypothetical protein
MSEFDRLRGGAREPGELFVKGLELREYSEQRWPGHGLYNQPGSLFPESRGTTGQLQVARNSQRLVAAVPEKSNETFSVHSPRLLAYAVHLLRSAALDPQGHLIAIEVPWRRAATVRSQPTVGSQLAMFRSTILAFPASMSRK